MLGRGLRKGRPPDGLNAAFTTMENKGLDLKVSTQQVNWRDRFQGWGFSWRGFMTNERGEWWLLAQVVLISTHALPAWSPWLVERLHWLPMLQLIGLLVFAVGLVLAFQGFWALGASLSPLPDPKPSALLITTGVYSSCRHPLYRAVLICSIGVFLAKASLLHLALFLILAVVLNGKAHREEKCLCQVHPEYLKYRWETPAIFPHFPGLDWRQG